MKTTPAIICYCFLIHGFLSNDKICSSRIFLSALWIYNYEFYKSIYIQILCSFWFTRLPYVITDTMIFFLRWVYSSCFSKWSLGSLPSWKCREAYSGKICGRCWCSADWNPGKFLIIRYSSSVNTSTFRKF